REQTLVGIGKGHAIEQVPFGQRGAAAMIHEQAVPLLDALDDYHRAGLPARAVAGFEPRATQGGAGNPVHTGFVRGGKADLHVADARLEDEPQAEFRFAVTGPALAGEEFLWGQCFAGGGSWFV